MVTWRVIFLTAAILGFSGFANAHAHASESSKANNPLIVAQEGNKGPFVLGADDVFPESKSKQSIKKKTAVKKVPVKKPASSPKKSKPPASFSKPVSSKKNQKPKFNRQKQQSPVTTSQKKPFVFGPEDKLEISVWENPDLKSKMPVRPDGFISFPLIGDVRAIGLTPAQLKKTITNRLKKFVTDPIVTVIVEQINSIKISVAGEVNEPDSYKVNRPITLLHLFALAKGFTEKADLKRSYILRNGRKLDIDFYALVKQDDFSQNIWLQSGDLVFIHDNFEGRVNIMGEIKLPQVVSFQEGMTVLDAILIANGLTDIAKPEGTKVYRKIRESGGTSKIQIIPVEMGEVIFEGDLSKNIRLRPGDIIHVPRSFF